MACLLGQRGMKVICVDGADPKIKSPDLRTTAISSGSRKILERAGIWDKIKDKCPIDDIRILDGASPVLLQFTSDEVEGRSFGWIVDNHDLKSAMIERLAEIKCAIHKAPAAATSFDANDEGACVTMASGEELHAKILIGADGRKSALRTWMVERGYIETRNWNYRQNAVICMVAHEHPHDNVAVEHFMPAGPFAILPFTDDESGTHRSAVVFTEHRSGRESWMGLSDAEFEAALAARFPENYGWVKLASKRASYPLGLIHASRYYAPRIALVADAAHGIHPIAGQGLNLGFRDLSALDDILGKAYESGADIGEIRFLEEYDRTRRPDNMAMVAMTDGLNRAFSNNISSVRVLRKIGLRAVSRLKPAKRFFMTQAMGERE